MRGLADLIQKLATIGIIVAGGSLVSIILTEPALETSVKVALVSGLGLLAAATVAAVFGTRRAADINAEAAREVAEINASNARQIEKIKAEAQRDLEREKEHRQWRRALAQPLLDRLIERQRIWTLIEMAYGDPDATEPLLEQIKALGGYEWAALAVLAPHEVSVALRELSEADGEAIINLDRKLEWWKMGRPKDHRPELLKAWPGDVPQGQAQRKALRALENYIYFGSGEPD